jgi:hypothetical protein
LLFKRLYLNASYCYQRICKLFGKIRRAERSPLPWVCWDVLAVDRAPQRVPAQMRSLWACVPVARLAGRRVAVYAGPALSTRRGFPSFQAMQSLGPRVPPHAGSPRYGRTQKQYYPPYRRGDLSCRPIYFPTPRVQTTRIHTPYVVEKPHRTVPYSFDDQNVIT